MTAPTPAPTRADGEVPAPSWGLAHVGLAFVAALVVTQVVGAVVLAIAGVPGDEVDDASLALRSVLQLGLWVGMLGSIGVVLRLCGGSWRRDLGLAARWTDVPLGLGLGVLCQLVLVPLVSAPWSWVIGGDLDDLKEPACRLAEKADSGLGITLFFLITVIGAPIVEEIFFRGFVQRSAVATLGRAIALPAVAVLFGITHFQALQFGALVAFGLVLGLMADRTGRIGLNVFTHIGFNATTAISLVATNNSLEKQCGDVLSLIGGLVR